MSIFNTDTEGNLKTKDNEILSYRVYTDNWVKIEGLNMREDFQSTERAERYCELRGITKIYRVSQ